jgi:predicted NUDIX family NTP pyrophosphohydrolase
MPKLSAGILLYHSQNKVLEILLVHPGGPFWAKKDAGAWSIPKGEFGAEEDPLLAARREFEEETGFELDGSFLPLTPIKQKSGKIIQVWALEGQLDPAAITSNTFSLEWPPRSGQQQEFPEVDRAGWFPLDQAREKIVPGQLGFLQELEALLKARR